MSCFLGVGSSGMVKIICSQPEMMVAVVAIIPFTEIGVPNVGSLIGK